MTINGSTNSGAWTYKLEVTEIATSIANRTSTIQVKAYLGRANSTSYLGGGYSVTVACDNQTQTQSGTINYPTYINAGDWLELQTFIFIVSNTENPTTINISSTMSSGDFTPSYASANGTMQLTVLHLAPTINVATIIETNQEMIALGIPDTTVVRYLSKKTITLDATAYDDATIDKYRLRHLNTDYALPSATTFQNSATFNTDYTQNDVIISNGKAQILQDIGDSLNGLTTDWLNVTINGTNQKPNGIDYIKPNLEITSTTIRRKSGNGINLTDNKANFNLVGTIYKGNDLIGNNNSVVQAGYKIWEDGTSEPASYNSVVSTVDSSGNVTISNYEISNIDFTKIYNYKIILTDNYSYSYSIDGNVPLGQPTWSEYKDRVDFLKLTVGGYNPFEYSGNETICGVWLDKPLYRQVLQLTTYGGDNWISLSDISSNIDTIVNVSGFTIQPNSSNITPIIYFYDSGDYSFWLYNNNNDSLNVRCGGNYGHGSTKLIVEYTKTTD